MTSLNEKSSSGEESFSESSVKFPGSRKFTIGHMTSYLRPKKSKLSKPKSTSMVYRSDASSFNISEEERSDSSYSFPSSYGLEECSCERMGSSFVLHSGICSINYCGSSVALRSCLEKSISTPSNLFSKSKYSPRETSKIGFHRSTIDLNCSLTDISMEADSSLKQGQKLWHQSLMSLRTKSFRSRIFTYGLFRPKKGRLTRKTPTSFSTLNKWLGSRKQTRAKPENLQALLKDKGQTQAFRKFLENEFNEENLDFWLEVEAYKKSHKKKQIKLSKIIYDKFVDIQSMREINIDAYTRKITKENLIQPDGNTFDLAQAKVFELMERDPFRRFIAKDCINDVKL